MRFLTTLLIALFVAPIFAQSDFTLNVHEIGDPDGLNPLTSKAANAENIGDNIFCRLLGYNRKTFDLEPVLAVARPQIEEINEGEYKGGMSLSYEIRPEATWNDGSPVTGHDYVFTVKAVKHPQIASTERRLSLEFIDDIVVDEANPRKFTIFSKKRFFRSEVASGYQVPVLPEYSYDETKILRGISIPELNNPKTNLNKTYQNFAEYFNGEKFATDPEYIQGCGPYVLKEWNRGVSVELNRKKDWWGDKIKDNEHLEAYPTKIIYKIIPGIAWVLPKMEKGELDIVRNVPPSKFFEAKNDPEFSKMADFYAPSQFAYHYLGFNSKSPKLSDKRVREAIAHAVDRDKIVNEIFDGEAIKINGPINPVKPYYNKNIKGVELDLDYAKTLLAKAGWKDTDGDDVLDKKINGDLVKLRLKYNYNNGNLVRKKIGEILKKNLAEIGIKLDLYPIDFATLLDNAKKRNYEVIALAWVNDPGLDDLKHIWHTSSDTESGGNRVGFGSAKTDKIIDEIAVTLDEQKRNELYQEIQEKIAEEHPYVFLVVPSELIVVKKGYTYPELGPIRPGYVTRLFQKK